MKPIPQELQAYFPKAYDPACPWWSMRDAEDNRREPEWVRTDGSKLSAFADGPSCFSFDKGSPLPPPPILVGQVWGAVGDDGTVAFEVLTVGTARDRGGVVYAWGLNVATPIADLIERGYLLRCPFGYAPWSGLEV